MLIKWNGELVVSYLVVITALFWGGALFFDGFYHVVLLTSVIGVVLFIDVVEQTFVWFKSGGLKELLQELTRVLNTTVISDALTALLRICLIVPVALFILRKLGCYFRHLWSRKRTELGLILLCTVVLLCIAFEKEEIASTVAYATTIAFASIPLCKHYQVSEEIHRVTRDVSAVMCKRLNVAKEGVLKSGNYVVASGTSAVVNTRDATVCTYTATVNTFVAIIDGIKGGYNCIWRGISWVVNSIRNMFQRAGNFTKSSYLAVINGATFCLTTVKNSVHYCMTATVNTVVGFCTSVKNLCRRIVSGILNFFLRIKNGIVEGYCAITNGIKRAALTVRDGLRSCLLAVRRAIRSGLMSLKNSLIFGIGRTKEAIRSGALRTKNCFLSSARRTKDFIKCAAESFLSGCVSTAYKVVHALISLVRFLKLKTLQFCRRVVESIKNAFNKAIEAVCNYFYSLKLKIKAYIRDTWIEPFIQWLYDTKEAIKAYIIYQFTRFNQYIYETFVAPTMHFANEQWHRIKILCIRTVTTTWEFLYGELLFPAGVWIKEKIPPKAPYLESDSDDELYGFVPTDEIDDHLFDQILERPLREDAEEDESDVEEFVPHDHSLLHSPNPSSTPTHSDRESLLETPVSIKDSESSEDEFTLDAQASVKNTIRKRTKRSAKKEELLKAVLARSSQSKRTTDDSSSRELSSVPEESAPSVSGLVSSMWSSAFSYAATRTTSALATGMSVVVDYLQTDATKDSETVQDLSEFELLDHNQVR